MLNLLFRIISYTFFVVLFQTAVTAESITDEEYSLNTPESNTARNIHKIQSKLRNRISQDAYIITCDKNGVSNIHNKYAFIKGFIFNNDENEMFFSNYAGDDRYKHNGDSLEWRENMIQRSYIFNLNKYILIVQYNNEISSTHKCTVVQNKPNY